MRRRSLDHALLCLPVALTACAGEALTPAAEPEPGATCSLADLSEPAEAEHEGIGTSRQSMWVHTDLPTDPNANCYTPGDVNCPTFASAQIQNAAMNFMYSEPNPGIRSKDFREALSRQVYDFDGYAGLHSANHSPAVGALLGVDTCRNSEWEAQGYLPAPLGPDLTGMSPVDWGYIPATTWVDFGPWDGRLGLEAALDSGISWPPLHPGEFVRPFQTSAEVRDTTTSHLVYSLLNSEFPFDVGTYWAGTSASARPRGLDQHEQIDVGRSRFENMNSSTRAAGSILHEVLHTRHFVHSCGRPRITARLPQSGSTTTFTNHLDLAAAGHGWEPRPYEGNSPTNTVDLNIQSRIKPFSLLSRRDTYPNNWENVALLYFGGYRAVRLFMRIDSEKDYDEIEIFDEVDQQTGTGPSVVLSGEFDDPTDRSVGFWTPWLRGEKIKIVFKSDGTEPNATPLLDSVGRPDKYGYTVLTYEGLGEDHEAIADLFPDVHHVARHRFTEGLFYDHGRATPSLPSAASFLSIPPTNYLTPVESLTLGSDTTTRVDGVFNHSGDADFIRLFVPSEPVADTVNASMTKAAQIARDWPADPGEYYLYVDTADANMQCALLEGSTTIVGTTQAGQFDGTRHVCNFSTPIKKDTEYFLVIEDIGQSTFAEYRADISVGRRCDFDGPTHYNSEADQALEVMSHYQGFQCGAHDVSYYAGAAAQEEYTACMGNLDAKWFRFTFEQGLTTIRSEHAYAPVPPAAGAAGRELELKIYDSQASHIFLTRGGPTHGTLVLPQELAAAGLQDGQTYLVKVSAPGYAANRFGLVISRGIEMTEPNVFAANHPDLVELRFETNIPAHTLCYGPMGAGGLAYPTASGAATKYDSRVANPGAGPTTHHVCTYVHAPDPHAPGQRKIEFRVGGYVLDQNQQRVLESIPDFEVTEQAPLCWDDRRFDPHELGE